LKFFFGEDTSPSFSLLEEDLDLAVDVADFFVDFAGDLVVVELDVGSYV